MLLLVVAPIGVAPVAPAGNEPATLVAAPTAALAPCTSRCAPSSVPPFSINAVLAADSFANAISAVDGVGLVRLEMVPQKEKNEESLSSEVDGEMPETCNTTSR